MEDTKYSDLFAHVMGTPLFHLRTDRTGFPASSLLTKPKAVVTIVIDSVGAETLHANSKLQMLRNAHATALTSSTSPSNTHTVLANLATGSSPSVHGIVGAGWRRPAGKLVSAYDESGMSFSASIADIFIQEWNGRSLVVSASGMPSLASALGVHPELAGDHLGWNAHVYALTENGFTSLYADAPCDAVFGASNSELNVKDVTVTVDGQAVTFKAQENYLFLSELAFVQHLISNLRSNKLVKDSIPDMYSLVFSGLKEIARTHAKDSVTFRAALQLVDTASNDFIVALNELYDNRVAAAIVALNPRAFPETAAAFAVKEKVHARLARLMYDENDFEAFYPAIYVRNEEMTGFSRDLMCANLQDSVGSDVTVHCLGTNIYARDAAAVNSSSSSSEAKKVAANESAAVWAFWLNFWVALIIFLFVLWGAYCLAYVGIDAGKDSLLFRATGRHHHQN